MVKGLNCGTRNINEVHSSKITGGRGGYSRIQARGKLYGYVGVGYRNDIRELVQHSGYTRIQKLHNGKLDKLTCH